MGLAEELRAALERGDLFVEYLPVVALADRRCVGGEALVRWQRGKVVLPGGTFVPRIENTPLSGKITYWVVDRVAEELGDWLDANPEAHVSINVPPEILGRGGLEYAAIKSGLHSRASQVILEITERGIPDRLGLDALNQMAALGVRLALDDTTLTGVNLALVARCPFDTIKIDHRVIAQLAEGKPAPDWLPPLQMLLKTTPLQVVAEGVETEFQAKWLRAAGVQLAHGYLFSPAISAEALKQLYADDRRPGRLPSRG